MKLAKKVLSVVLAVAIALGAFAIAASANGNPDADYQVKIWLTGAVSDLNWSSKTKMNLTEGEESAAGATIEAQPGDEVMIRVYMTNNYYVHTIQSNLFYSSGLLDAGDIYLADTGAACTTARLNKMQVFNTNNYFNELHASKTGTSNCWSLQNETANQKVDESWPTDDDGNELFNHDDWKWNRFFIYATEGVGETCILEDDTECIISMPVRIPADAAPGTTYTVTIPEGLEQRSAKIYGATRVSEIGICEGESEPCDMVDAAAQAKPNMQYGDDNQYFDYSEATLTIQIPGAAAVDTAELEAKLGEAAALLTGNLTQASIDALNAAIEQGNAALTSNDQATVNTAVEVLVAAINAAEAVADYSALNAAIARYEALDAADWDAASFAEATAKYEAAKAVAPGLGVSQQATVSDAAAALNAAIDALDAALDYSAIEATYNSLVNKNVADYTDDTVARFNAALAAAKALIDNKNAADQAEINAANDELVAADAALELKAADYTAIDKAIADFEALDSKAWTSASYAEAKAAYDTAKAVARDLKITDQATIDEAATALAAEIADLVPATAADYSALDKAIADAKALVADNYVSFAGVAAALAAAEDVARDLTSEEQATIDEATKALTDAMAALVEADADYTAVEAAKAAAAAKVAENDQGILRYTDASIEAINNAVEAVVEGLKKKDQATVDGYATAINDAIANVEYRPYDYTAINDHIAAIEANDASYYDAADYAAYLAAKEALVWNYTHEQYAAAKLQEVKFLKVNPAAAGSADYTAVNDAIAAFRDKIAAADYEQDGIDAVNAIIEGINWDLNANDQATVDKYAEDIIAATAALVEVVVELVDYTRIDAAIAAAKALDEELYTVASFSDVTVALYTAESISRDLTVDQQEYVDEVAATLEAAIAALEALADYSKLEAAILRAGTYDKNVWTNDTWAVVEEKLAAAKAVNPGLGVSAQDEIDAAAQALNDALDALEAKEVVSSISTINWTPVEGYYNTFTVSVVGRAAKVQFIEEDNQTRTFDRYHPSVSIESYNASGEKVNSLDRSVAYEIWTISTNLIGPDVRARAKVNNGSSYVWEAETYDFTYTRLEPKFDAEVRSITPNATSGARGPIVTTVIAGPDAQGVRFVSEDGSTCTYYAAGATVLDNGDLQFVGNAWGSHKGLNTITVLVRQNNKWVEAGTFEYTVE